MKGMPEVVVCMQILLGGGGDLHELLFRSVYRANDRANVQKRFRRSDECANVERTNVP